MDLNFRKIHTWPSTQLLLIFIVSLCVKIILVPAYFSTDQDVHQNWLRITANKPLREWYFDVINR
jgi:alpha-1,3-glucosyltransferase